MNIVVMPYRIILFLLGLFLSTTARAGYATEIVVAQDGSGDYTSIQAALDNTKSFPDEHISIYVKKGVYQEKVSVPAWNTNLSIIGECRDSTIITYSDHFERINKGRNSTFYTATLSVMASDVRLENLTILNSAGDIGQAIALSISGNRCVVDNCNIEGHQDTLYCTGEGNRQYFVNCRVSGTTDFIFGNATALFEQCTIHAKKNSYITAASTTENQKYGFVFKNCRLTADEGVSAVFLGRPWRKYAKTVFINCDYGHHILPAAWEIWSNKEEPETTYYAEFTAAAIDQRVRWSKQLTEEEAQSYTRENILGFASMLYTQQEIPLYEGTIPNNRNVPKPERIVHREEREGRAFFDTSIPTLTVFTPRVSNGQAVIICPGGGYTKTAFDKEGVLVAEALVQSGITVFVLKYRIPQDETNFDKSLTPLQDAQQAIRHLRMNADKYGIRPDQIGIMGFSAGGHLAASAAVHFQTKADPAEANPISVRPDFVALIYPVISFEDELTHRGSRENLLGVNPEATEIVKWSAEQQVTEHTPEAFLVHAADDEAVSVGNSLAFYQACLEKKVPVEMHLYARGGHGFGLYNETTEDDWMERLKNWLATIDKS